MTEDFDLRDFPYGNVIPEHVVGYRRVRGEPTRVAIVKIVGGEIALTFESILSINTQERFDAATARSISRALSYYASVIEARQNAEQEEANGKH